MYYIHLIKFTISETRRYNTLSRGTEATASWTCFDFAIIRSANFNISDADKFIRTFDPRTSEIISKIKIRKQNFNVTFNLNWA